MAVISTNSPLLRTKVINADGNDALRVVITQPSPDDQPGPTNLDLSNNNVQADQPNGLFIGNLSVDSGTPPLVFSIEQDLTNSFQVVGSELQTSKVLDINDGSILNVGIRCTDNNGKFVTRNFAITVIPQSGFINTKSYGFSNLRQSFIILPERIHNNGSPSQPEFSIGLWAKDGFESRDQTVISTFEAAGTQISGFSVRLLATGQFELFLKKQGNNSTRNTYDPPPGYDPTIWNLFGFSFRRDPTEFDFYINGVRQIAVSSITNGNIRNNAVANNDTYIGRAPQGGEYFTGLLDGIFSTQNYLEATDWVIAYNGGNAINYDDTSINPDHWYRAEDDVLPTILDTVGTLNGGSTQIEIVNDAPQAFQNNFAVEFDGATNYFIGSGVPDFSQPATISFWVKRTTPLQTDLVFAWNAQSITTNNSAKIYFDSNSTQRFIFRIDSPSGDIIRRFSLGASSLNNWNHICITASDFTDATTINLYRNAILLSPNQTNNSLTVLPTIPDKVSIGGGVTGGSLFAGEVDEYAFFSGIEASQAQVEELFNLGSPGNIQSTSLASDLATWYRFGDRNNQGSVMENQVNGDALVMINFDSNFYVPGAQV